MLFISEIGLNYNAIFANCEELIKTKWAGANIENFNWAGKKRERLIP